MTIKFKDRLYLLKNRDDIKIRYKDIKTHKITKIFYYDLQHN